MQDRNGQPKRDITTIIHILNDLLCAQYKNYSATATPSSSSSASGAQPRNTKTASSTTTSSAGPSSFSSKSTSTTGSSSSKNPGKISLHHDIKIAPYPLYLSYDFQSGYQINLISGKLKMSLIHCVMTVLRTDLSLGLTTFLRILFPRV